MFLIFTLQKSIMSDSFEQQTKKGKAKKSRFSNDSFIDRLLQDTFSDDEDFLPAQRQPVTTLKNAQQYLEELDEELKDKKENVSKKQTWVNDLQADQFIVYFHCPVCLLPGHLSRSGTGIDIEHIKQCALRHGLHHRELISRLQSCPQKLERRKPVNTKKIKKTIKKESKVEQQKLEMSSQEVDEKLKVCKLMIISHFGQDDDEEIAKKKVHCQEHLQKRVASSVHSKKLVSLPTEEEKKKAKEKAKNNCKPGQSSPKNFIKSYLNHPEKDYYIPGFKEYFKFDDD